MFKNKRAVIENLQALIPMLVGIMLVLVIGFLIMAEVKTQVIDTESAKSTTEINESLTITENAITTLAYQGNAMQLSCGSAYNITGGDPLPTSDYTCTTDGLNYTNASGSGNTSILLTYSFKNKTQAYNGTVATVNATQDIPGWLPIIVITLIGALLLGLVQFFRKQK